MEVLSYEPQTYRSLSSLSKALDRFDNGHGQHVLDTEIRYDPLRCRGSYRRQLTCVKGSVPGK